MYSMYPTSDTLSQTETPGPGHYASTGFADEAAGDPAGDECFAEFDTDAAVWGALAPLAAVVPAEAGLIVVRIAEWYRHGTQPAYGRGEWYVAARVNDVMYRATAPVLSDAVEEVRRAVTTTSVAVA